MWAFISTWEEDGRAVAVRRVVFEVAPDGQFSLAAGRRAGQSANYMQGISLIKTAASHKHA